LIKHIGFIGNINGFISFYWFSFVFPSLLLYFEYILKKQQKC
jgi:hypothetical protein